MTEDRNQHWDACLAQARAHADHLMAAVSKGELNASAVHNLMRGFLDQPAYYPEWRSQLLFEAMKGRAL